jgi:hypothetical protein
MKIRERYTLVQDNDDCWFLIPADNMAAWGNWIIRSYEYDASLSTPPWARAVQGSPSRVTFENPSVIS